METPLQGHRHIPWVRLTIAVIAFLFLAGAAALWILSAQHIIRGSWSDILPIIFTVLGIGVPIFLWLFPAPAEKSAPAEQDEGNGGGGAATLVKTPGKDEALPQVTTSPLFFFCEPLTDQAEFFGRLRERQTLLDRSYASGATSIVGPRRIGKTWLMTYLKLVAPKQLGERFRVGYLDATSPGCKTVAGFTAKALQELGIPTLPSSHAHLGLDALEKAVEELKARNNVFILCIDEFEGLGNRQVFDLHFFTELRAIASSGGLALVAASKKPLIEIVGEIGETSRFFNIFQQLTLEPLSLADAEKFVQKKGDQAKFTADERARLLQYGHRLPIRLQLTGQMLLQDKTLAAREDPNLYRPKDPNYWQDFEERLERTYRGVVES